MGQSECLDDPCMLESYWVGRIKYPLREERIWTTFYESREILVDDKPVVKA